MIDILISILWFLLQSIRVLAMLMPTPYSSLTKAYISINQLKAFVNQLKALASRLYYCYIQIIVREQWFLVFISVVPETVFLLLHKNINSFNSEFSKDNWLLTNVKVLSKTQTTVHFCAFDAT